jgi:hypothetical protein
MPDNDWVSCLEDVREGRLTFLPFMKDGWARVVVTSLGLVGKLLATALMNTLLRHDINLASLKFAFKCLQNKDGAN